MINFLPKKYSKIFIVEKVLRGASIVFLVLISVFFIGTIFLLPSFFSLKLVAGDILRNAEVEEALLEKKDVASLEKEISFVNTALDSYEKNSMKSRSFSGFLSKFINLAPSGIRLDRIDFSQAKDGSFFLKLFGEASLRENIISYTESMRDIEEIKEIKSPLSNLLKNENAPFVLEADIKSDFYEYKNK